MVLGRHHGMRACAIGHAQAGAEIVRIGHAIEHQQQCRAGHVIEHFVQRMPLRQRIHACHHPLVAWRTGQASQPLLVAVHQPGTGIGCPLHELRCTN